MPTERISDIPSPHSWSIKPCKNPEHNPPGHRVFKNGIYKHTCPGCGHIQYFTVEDPTMEVGIK